ncbi:MAG TPA: class I SAM-dependent methyltransferase [Chloroflexia bacterium]|nr:class I SAM-dependent methyltransferase [Chloroflexia bacterium]
MNHQDHVQLLEGGVPAQQPGGVWADLGSGWGAFTLALADLLGPGATIYSVDKDGSALREQEGEMRARFPSTNVQYVRADFTKRLDLPPLDGIVMANALHFVRHKEPVLDIIRSHLKPEGRLILVEYNADSGNMWVPFPLSYPTWERLAERSGFASTRLLTTVPSRFLREIYSALSVVG